MNGEHSADPTGRANVEASETLGDLTQNLPGQSPKNVDMAATNKEASTATPSAAPPLLQHQ